VTTADLNQDRRRSVYLQVLRSHPLTLLQAFDQPVMETNCLRRSRSTVSTQALTLMNSPAVVRWAGAFAQRVLAQSASSPGDSRGGSSVPATVPENVPETGSDARGEAGRVVTGRSRELLRDPLGAAVVWAYGRGVAVEEREELERFWREQQTRLEGAGVAPAAAREQAFADLCHMLLSSNEFVYID